MALHNRIIGKKVPVVNIHIRKGPDWWDTNSNELFDKKTILVFGLPGAFTPTCSTKMLPGYEADYDKFIDKGVDEVYCHAVNDSFVMNAWAESLNIEKVKMLPDGNGDFAQGLGTNHKFRGKGFGGRTWRYVMLVKDSKVVNMYTEVGAGSDIAVNDPNFDPYEHTSSTWMLDHMDIEAKVE
jgi:peroxiredoxin